MPLSAAPVEEIAAALSRASLQHQVIAGNVANRDTQGYQRLKTQFDRAMDGVTRAVVVDTPSADVSIERDLIALSANAAYYQTLTRVLNRYFTIVGVITAQGRG